MSECNDNDKTRLAISESRKKIEDLMSQINEYDNIITKNVKWIQNHQEELKQLEYKRVTKLTLQRDDYEKDDQKVKQDNESHQKFTRTLIEGYLLKEGSGLRKGKVVRTYIWLEVARHGTPIILWAPEQLSGTVKRAVVKSVLSGKQAFKVELGFGRNLKRLTIVLVDYDQEVIKSWVHQIKTALTAHKSGHSWKGLTEEPVFVKEITFESTPLGFGIAASDHKNEELMVASIQSEELLLKHGIQVGMSITECNGKSLTNVNYNNGLAIFKTAIKHISKKNPVTVRFRGYSRFVKEPANERLSRF